MIISSKYKFYRKCFLQPMRPYIPGEDLSGISVGEEDRLEATADTTTPGMIAINPARPADQWYIARKFFEDNYELATPDKEPTP